MSIPHGSHQLDPVHHRLKAAIERDIITPNPSLLPFLRAYGLGYAGSTLPSVIRILVTYVMRLRGPKSRRPHSATTAYELLSALLRGFSIKGFAMFCGILAGGGRYLEDVLYPRILVKIREHKQKTADERLPLPTVKDVRRAHLLSVFGANSLASAFALWYYHRVEASSRIASIDLTLLAMVRAIDVLVRANYQDSSFLRRYTPEWLAEHADTVVFSLSCLEIMFAWFYEPSRLPRAYNTWISKTAQLDPNVVLVLRLLYKGDITYGVQGPYTHLLRARAAQLGMPAELGDPAFVEKVPCELYHGRVGGASLFNCEIHGAWRWWISFKNALKIYTPVFLIPTVLFRRKSMLKDPMSSFLYIAKSSMRSSAFLATFVAIIYYSVCMVRSRAGPALFPRLPKGTFDNFYAPFVGCLLCGLSVLIETKHRRGEMALYVAPRAVFAFYERMSASKGAEQRALSHRREFTEIMIFASSMGVVMAALKERPDVLRGVVKGILGFVAGTNGAAAKREAKKRALVEQQVAEREAEARAKVVEKAIDEVAEMATDEVST